MSSFHSVWPNIYHKLKNPPPGINLGDFPSKLPDISKIKLDSVSTSDTANAIGFVTTEDVDHNGKIDTIHISSPKIEKILEHHGINLGSISNLNSLNNEQLLFLLAPFVEIISHELGHINDYKPNQPNPFPGGESVAENAAKGATNKISLNSANISYKFEKRWSHSMKLFSYLTKLADKLDRRGETEISDFIDSILSKYAEPGDPFKTTDFGLMSPDKNPPTLRVPSEMGLDLPGRPEGNINQAIEDIKERAARTANFRFHQEPNTVKKIQEIIGTEVDGLWGTETDKAWNPKIPNYKMPEAFQNKTITSAAQALQILQQLGVEGRQALTVDEQLKELESRIASKTAAFHEKIVRFIDGVMEQIPWTSMSGSLRESLLQLRSNQSLTNTSAAQFFSGNILPQLNVIFEAEQVEQMKSDFRVALSSWADVAEAQNAKNDLIAHSRQSFSIDHIEDPLDKISALKTHFDHGLWTASNRVGMRSRR